MGSESPSTRSPEPASDAGGQLPHELCGYPVDSALSPGVTYLAIGPGGRGIVLKKLDADCLLGGVLHPSIRERLCRIRELAHAGVANLHGVGREAEQGWLIWEYLEGQTFDEYLASAPRTSRDLMVVARELILAVDSLHMQGIVHGAIIGGNVIVGPDGGVRLTHVSPLLYTETAADLDSVVALLQHAVQIRGETDTPLGRLLDEAAVAQTGLRPLGAKVAALLDTRKPPVSEPEVRKEERNVRRRILTIATLITALGLAIGYGVWRAVNSGADLHTVLRWLPK